MRLFFLIFCDILLLFSCGSDETSVLIKQTPNFFPDAVGSQWIYRNSEGIQSTLEVSGETNIEGKNYSILKYTPPIEEREFDLLKPTYYRATQDQAFFAVGEKIDHYVQNEVPALVQDDFAGLELGVSADTISYPELAYFQFPMILNSEWEAFNLKISGSISLQNLALLQFPFDVMMRVTGEVVAQSPLDTPAGRFEETYQIEYQTEITYTLFSETDTIEQNQTVWFTPHVGPVKIEDEGGVTELIAYSLAGTPEE